MSEMESPVSPDDPINADDVWAGKLLGGMLSIFFLYTIVTTLGVVWWTWKSISG